LPAPTDPGAGSDPALTRRRRVLFAVALVCGIGLLILPVLLTDGRELWARATSIDPLMLAVPVFLTFASYAAMSQEQCVWLHVVSGRAIPAKRNGPGSTNNTPEIFARN